MKPKSINLPEFSSPPINEVVTGVYFNPIEGFKMPHFGRYWELVKAQYPLCEEAPPIYTGSFSNEIPLPRVWLLDETRNSLIQMQRDMFHFNWRRVAGHEDYPRFSVVHKCFHNNLKKFIDFLSNENIARPDIRQCELTYINHIPAGEIWNEPIEIGKLLPDFNWRSHERFLPKFESTGWTGIFALPEDFGNLTINVKHAKKKVDGTPIYILELSAKGLGNNNSNERISEWFNVAHEWIVRGFCDFTAENIQKNHWGRIDL